jgi:hypothetical protein
MDGKAGTRRSCCTCTSWYVLLAHRCGLAAPRHTFVLIKRGTDRHSGRTTGGWSGSCTAFSRRSTTSCRCVRRNYVGFFFLSPNLWRHHTTCLSPDTERTATQASKQSGKGGGPGGPGGPGGMVGGPGPGAGDRGGGHGAGPERTMMRSATLGGSGGRAGEPVSLNPRVSESGEAVCVVVMHVCVFALVRSHLTDLYSIRLSPITPHIRTLRRRPCGRSGSSNPCQTSLAFKVAAAAKEGLGGHKNGGQLVRQAGSQSVRQSQAVTVTHSQKRPSGNASRLHTSIFVQSAAEKRTIRCTHKPINEEKSRFYFTLLSWLHYDQWNTLSLPLPHNGIATK